LAYARTHDAQGFFRGILADIHEPTAPFGLLDVHGDGSEIREACEDLDIRFAQRLRLQARRLGMSAATLFHAIWALVVARTSGRDDVVYGTVLLGRMLGAAGSERILGVFINTLPLRITISRQTVRALVEQTQQGLVKLLNHEQASLVEAQRCSGIEGSAPLFTALLNYRHSVARPEADWAGVGAIEVLATVERTNYPVTLVVDDFGDGFTLTAQTDRRIAPQRVLAYVQRALTSLVEALEQDPEKAALSLEVLPEAERQQVLEAFNATDAPYPKGKLAHELFEEQVLRTPEQVAVEYEGESLTYEELNARANQLARYLRAKGVGPDERVGICTERSLEMVVGLLGILKAGGAYVPLDPGYPPERLAYMLKDAAPRLVLIQERLRGCLADPAVRVLALDAEWPDVAQQPVHTNPGLKGLTAETLAYVIYTSGSTGEPKGVAAEHRSMVNRIAAQAQIAPFAPDDVCCHKTSIGFVDAVFEILGPLCYGRPLVLVPPSVSADPLGLSRLIQKERVTRLISVPTLARAMLESDESRECLQGLRGWTLSGEELQADLLLRLGEALPNCRFVNLYGSSEVAGDATWYPADAFEGGRVPIGKPIQNTRVYLLNERLEPVPTGVTGEIHVAGVGLAREYLHRPELTAERFLSDPFSTDPKARMYKTGDLGRWRPDGAIEYLGRNDQQVKIRGFRIELGEIEAQLLHHPEVKEAAVLAREEAEGEKRLVGYVIPRDPARTPAAESLREHLKGLLPEYMVPSAFVALQALPLTPSGKLDRRALPAPDLSSFASREYEPPRGEVEEILAGIWRELLHVERVGRHDNFFELGGHSLLAVRMIAAVKKRLNVVLLVSAFFKYPTIGRIAEFIDSLRSRTLSKTGDLNIELEEGSVDFGESSRALHATLQQAPASLPAAGLSEG